MEVVELKNTITCPASPSPPNKNLLDGLNIGVEMTDNRISELRHRWKLNYLGWKRENGLGVARADPGMGGVSVGK